MNGLKIASASGVPGQQVSRPAWQEEIQQLHVNFFVLDALIHQPVGGCPHTIRQYTMLQQTIADTLETLLAELEQDENPVANPAANPAADFCTPLLRKHAVIMRRLNVRVDTLIQGVVS